MLLAETDWIQTISFWGGIASIVALLMTLGGGVFALYSRLNKWNQAELDKLQQAQNEIANRTKSATTQGRRMDLFIYQQSMFSSLRFRLTLLEIAVSTSHVIGLILLFWIATLDLNADYALDHIAPSGSSWRNHYPLLAAGTFVFVIFLNVDSRRRLRNQRHKVTALSNTFVDELEELLEINQESLGG